MLKARWMILQILFLALLVGMFLLRYGFEAWSSALWLGIGFAVGVALLWLDETVAYPNYRELDGEKIDLVTRSTLFLLAYVPITLFMLSSSGSLWGVGIVVGLGAGLSSEMLLLQHQPEAFVARFFQQLQRSLSPREIQGISWGFAVFVGTVTALVFL